MNDRNETLTNQPQNWRELLFLIIRNDQEKQRFVRELNIAPITLSRWANNKTKPQLQSLHQLLRIFPTEFRDQFRKLLIDEFPELSKEGFSSSPKGQGVIQFISPLLY